MTLLKATNQYWKHLASSAVLLSGGAALWALLSGVIGTQFKSSGDLLLMLAFSGLVLVGGLVWPAIAIVCPRCRLRWFWYSVTRRPLSDALTWYKTATVCPRCGLDTGEAPTVPRSC